MTPEQKAVYVMAQIAVLNARVAGMEAENAIAEMKGNSLPFGEAAFEHEVNTLCVNHNAVIALFLH